MTKLDLTEVQKAICIKLLRKHGLSDEEIKEILGDA